MSNNAIALPGQETLVASWSALARISPGARLIHSTVATAAVFPSWAPLNNAILQIPRDAPTSRATGLYANAGVDAWAFWVPSTRTDLDAAGDGYQVGGFKRDTTTLVMKAQLPSGMRRHDDVVRTSIASASRAGDEPVPAADLGEPDPEPGLIGWVMVDDDVAVAGAWSFPTRAGLRDLRRRDRAGEASPGPWRDAWWSTPWPIPLAAARGPRHCNRCQWRGTCTRRWVLTGRAVRGMVDGDAGWLKS